MVSDIPSFRFESFYKNIEDALVCEIVCDNWGAFGGLLMQVNRFYNISEGYYIFCILKVPPVSDSAEEET